MHRVYIGIGSNLGDSLAIVESACCALADHPECRFIRRSNWYQSAAVGPAQPDYTNGVALIETRLCPLDTLDLLQQIECQHHRQRLQHWGPRTLDLDLLLFDQQSISEPRLTVPHPHLHWRNFVLYPLLDLDPDLALPDGRSIKALAESAGVEGLRPLPQ